jgi:predicted nucleotidyltransferase component of viral defense system
VDIDFDFSENLPMDETMAVRETIRDTIRRYMAMSGYTLSEKSKKYHTLDSDVYQYSNAGGVKDNIKIESNYSLRSHVLPITRQPIETFGFFTSVTVLTFDPIEVFGSKISALLSRSAARDLYDVNNMLCFGLFDETQTEMLRKCVVFYAAIGGEQAPEAFDFIKIDALTERDIKTQLTPMLRKRGPFNLVAARERVRRYLTALLELPDNEKEFLAAFRNGEYRPELIFNGNVLERVRNHPMASWKMQVHRQSKNGKQR